MLPADIHRKFLLSLINIKIWELKDIIAKERSIPSSY